MAVECSHDGDASVWTGRLSGLRRRSGLNDEDRREQNTYENEYVEAPDPTMLHDLSSHQRGLSAFNPPHRDRHRTEEDTSIRDRNPSKLAICPLLSCERLHPAA
jgi:hypothetical protein